MICTKTCPNCKSKINVKKILEPIYKHDADTFICSECNSTLKSRGDKIAGYIGLIILLIPGFLFSGGFELLNVLKKLPILLFVILPVCYFILICLLPIQLEDEK